LDGALRGETLCHWENFSWLSFLRPSGTPCYTVTYLPAVKGRNTGLVARVRHDLTPVFDSTRPLVPLLALVGMGTTALVFTGLWFLVRKLDRLLRTQQELIERVHADLRDRNRLLDDINRRKDEFLSICSHDLRSPLVSIAAGSKVLLTQRQGPLNGQQTEIVASFEAKAKDLLHLINDLLDVARIEAGREELHLERFDLARLLLEVSEAHREPAAHRQAVLTLAAPPEGLVLVADRIKVLRICHNLVSNAVKHTRPGEILIRLRAEAGAARLEVIDRGPGIPAEELPRLFERFSGLARNKRTREEGTGLGLFIAKSLAELHGGTIAVHSEVGHSATFVVCLPLEPPKTSAPAAV